MLIINRLRYWAAAKTGNWSTNDWNTLAWRDGAMDYHRDGDQPAVIESQGWMMWMRHGQLHREGGKPAHVHQKSFFRSELHWYVNGELHRDGDLPAVVNTLGIGAYEHQWMQHGQCHREGDLPAYVSVNGSTRQYSWFVNDVLHREGDMPALVRVTPSGVLNEWYRHGVRHRDNGLPAVVCSTGTCEWWVNGQRHRSDDLPAQVDVGTGLFAWHVRGHRHRDGDLPAVISQTRWAWFVNTEHKRLHPAHPTTMDPYGTFMWTNAFGQLHREHDKPALVCACTSRYEWYINGFLHRDGQKPAVVHEDGYVAWCQAGLFHRDGDQPAIVDYTTGVRTWMRRGQQHRDDDKPAVEMEDGTLKWFIDGAYKRLHDPTQPVIVQPTGKHALWNAHNNCVVFYDATDFEETHDRFAFVHMVVAVRCGAAAAVTNPSSERRVRCLHAMLTSNTAPCRLFVPAQQTDWHKYAATSEYALVIGLFL